MSHALALQKLRRSVAYYATAVLLLMYIASTAAIIMRVGTGFLQLGFATIPLLSLASASLLSLLIFGWAVTLVLFAWGTHSFFNWKWRWQDKHFGTSGN